MSSSSSSSSKHYLLLQAHGSSSSSFHYQLVRGFILISIAAPLIVATPASTVTATAARRPMQQRALFVAPRSFPSFISICSRLSSGSDHRIQHHSVRTLPVAHRASSHLPAINNNPFKLLHANNGSSNEMSTTSTHNNFHNSGTNQQSLMEQLAIRLVQGNNDDVVATSPPKNNAFVKPIKACIAVAGGGSNAASSIASTPGASSILLESIVTYDRRSFADFVTHNIAVSYTHLTLPTKA